jgi:hypothetical protein
MTEVNPNTKLKELLLRQSNIVTEAKFKDNEKAHEILNDFLTKLSARIEKDEEITAKRLNNLEVFVTTELLGPKSLEYKPPGHEEYLGLGQTLNLIFEKLNRIEASLGL